MGKPSVEVLFAGNGEIATLMRSHFASAAEKPKGLQNGLQTLLGAVETWSSCLKNAFGILFNSCCPMFLVWECAPIQSGAGERILFYNDAYLSLLKATQHRIPLGQSVKDGWAEGWSPIQQDVEQVFSTGQALQREQTPFPPDQNGNSKDHNAIEQLRQQLYNWSYTAVWDETDQIRGVFATVCQATVCQVLTGEDRSQDRQAGQAHQPVNTPISQTPTIETPLQQTEAALQESEARFQAFMSHSPTSAWVTDQAGCLLYLSPTYFQMFQLPQQDVVGKQIQDIYAEEFAQQFLENNRRVFETGQVVETVETAPRPDGSTGSFLVYKFPIPQASGEMLLGGVAVDITERQRTEEMLQRQQEELRLITNALPALIAYVDEHHYYRFNNQTYETWFGQPATNFTGKHVREVLGEAAYAKVCPYMEQALAGQRVNFESQIPYREGGMRYIMADYVPHFNRDGKVEGYFSLVSDISERKQAEAERERLLQELAAERARFEAVLRQMPEGVIIADAASEELILANERTNQILQHSFELNLELEDYDQTTPFHAYHPDGRIYAPSEYPLVRSLRTGEIINHEEMELRYADGHRIVIDASSSPIFDCQGQISSAIVVIQDITERQQIEQALRASETLHRTLSEAVPNFIWSCDENGHADFVNSRWIDYTGLTIEQLNAGGLAQVNHPEDMPRLMAQWDVAKQQGEPFEAEFRYRRKDGEYRWFMGRAVPIKNEAGKIVRWIGTTTNIHDRKQAEIALRQSEERTQLAIKVARLGTWQYNLNLDLVELDERMRQIWGEPDGTTILPLPRVIERIHPDDRERVVAAIGAALDPSSSGTYELDYRIVWDDGTERWVSVNGQVLFAGEGELRQPINFLGTALDITERKQTEAALSQSEERLRLAMAAAQMGTWDVNLITGKAIWSEQHFTILGYKPTATGEASEEMWNSRIHPDDLEWVIQEWQQSRQEHRAYQVEYRVIRADNGQVSWLAALGSFTYNQNGEAIRSIGVLFDITHRKQTEMALAAQEQRYRYIFEAVNISIWEEDFSEVKAAINQLKAAGVQDFRQYLIDHPEFVQQAIEMVHLRDINQASLKLFGAQTKAELLNSLHQIFTPETKEAFIGELLTIAAEETHFAAETVLQNLQGQRLQSWFSITFPPPSEPYDRVLVSVVDITDRKQAEEALRNSEQQLRLAQQAADAGLWDWDIARNQVIWSEEYYQLYGLDETVTPSYENWIASICESDREQTDHAARAALEHQININVEFRILHPIKGVRWLTVIGQTFYDDYQQPKRMTGIALDITNRKQAEAALKETERRLQLALGAAQMIAWDINLKTNHAICSENAKDIWGTNVGTAEEFFSRIHPDDLTNVLQTSKQAMRGAAPYVLEYRIFNANGGLRWMMSQGSVVQQGVDGKAERVVGVSIDITARKQAEAEREQLLAREQSANETLQRFIEHTPVAVIMLDREMRYLFASHRWIADYAPGYTDLKGLFHYEVMTDIPKHWQDVHQRCLAGATERCEEDYYLRADGSAFWLHWEVLPWYASDGEIGGIIIFAENITERKLAAHERERLLKREQAARQEAEQANRLKDEFLAVLSHELRSPLNPILGWTKLLQTRQFDQAATKRALETIERNAKLQTQLIDDLLDVSRILRGKMVLNVSPIDLATVIDAALETVRLSAEAKGITIQQVIADNVEPISGDSGRLQQVVWNLLSNAVKFTPSGGQITIQLEQIGREAQIQVTDTGKGITPEFVPYVFEYFRQEDGTTTRKFGGLGLGLAIVRYLTELHGGTVKGESPGVGLGTTFTVSLPISNHGTSSQPNEVKSINPVARALPLAELRILVVDDEPDMRELIFTILEQAGAQIKVAASAIEALAALETFKPDILISDIGMPEVDGYGLLRQIRCLSPEQRGTLPAIALTAYAGELDQQQAAAAGFQKHIAKPVEPEELVKAIITLTKSQSETLRT